MHKSLTRQVLALIGAAFTAVLSFIVAVIPAGAMTVTFVRHGESQANADGIIDTTVPGPGLTSLGWEQADEVADDLAEEEHDGIYASTMVRTQQTAIPYAALLDGDKPWDQVTISTDPSNPDLSKDIVVLNGLQEINAGIFEGSSEDEGLGRLGYALAPIAWTLGLRFVRIPGSEDGNEFDARVDAALAQMEEQGSENPVVFSHGATIMFWTMMNVDNPDLTLLLTHQLDNTDVVVVESNGEGGWTLVSWDGVPVGEATLPTQLFVNTRDLIVAPQTAVYNFSRDTSVETGVQGVEDVAEAPVKFATDTVRDIGNAVQDLGSATQTNSTTAEVTETTNGATDLTAGNKVAPGDRVATAISRNNARVNEAVQDVKNEIATSITKVGEAVKKVTDPSDDTADGADEDAA